MTNPTPKTKLWIKILLLASLGLNLAVVGVLAGLSNTPPHTSRSIRAQDIVEALTFALPDEYRKQMRQALVAHRQKLMEEHGSVASIRHEVLGSLLIEPFDISAFDQILARERDHFVSLGELAYETLLGIVANMTDEERRAFVERLDRTSRP